MKKALLAVVVITLLPLALSAGCKSSTPLPTASPVAASFFFLIQPAGATAGAVFTKQPVVVVLDTYGETDNAYTGAVTLAITKGTGPGGAVLSGKLTVNAVAGAASFSGLSIDTAGSGYSLMATAGGLAPAISAPFDVAAAAPAATAIR